MKAQREQDKEIYSRDGGGVLVQVL